MLKEVRDERSTPDILDRVLQIEIMAGAAKRRSDQIVRWQTDAQVQELLRRPVADMVGLSS